MCMKDIPIAASSFQEYYLYNINTDENEMIINSRFDVMSNSNSFDQAFIVNFIKNIIDVTN